MSYVITRGCIFICNQGATLTYTGPTSKLLSGADILTMTSIMFVGAGVCTVVKLAPTPCTPLIIWANPSKKLFINGQPAVSMDSKMTCAKGGMITIVPSPAPVKLSSL